MRTIILSAGHDFSDPGAVYDAGTRENVLTMKLVEQTAKVLRAHGIGVLTVPDDLSLFQTIEWINQRQAELCVEIHCNSGPADAHGVEAWYYHNDSQSANLSKSICDGVYAEVGMSIRGVFDEVTNRYGRLGFVHDTKPLASLFEAGFITNKEDRELLASDEGRFKIGKGIARGILNYMKEAWKPQILVNQEKKYTKDEVNQIVQRLYSSIKSKLAEQINNCQKQTDAEIAKIVQSVDYGA